jgi:hypothetical protein
MKSVFVKEFGGAENLEIREVENPHKPEEKKNMNKWMPEDLMNLAQRNVKS